MERDCTGSSQVVLPAAAAAAVSTSAGEIALSIASCPSNGMSTGTG